jgi:hypothetical protein
MATENKLAPASVEPAKKVAWLRADSSKPRWCELDAEAVGSTPEAQRKAQDEANAARKELSDYLRTVLTTPNLVVLAGSGASLGKVGGPSMADLWGKASELPNFAAVLAAVRQPPDDKWIENLMSRCIAAQQFLDGETKVLVSDFLSAAEKMIWTACSQFVPNADLSGHETFLRRMARRRVRAPRLKLFTTNYDLCFETVAGRLGIIFMDGFSFTEPRRFDPRLFDYDIVRRAAGIDEANDFVEGVAQFYKLHGSVNWDRVGAEIVQAQAPKNPCLVYPATAKYEQSYFQPHLECMARFQSASRSPNTCLVTIGFGFNDNHLSAPILAAVKSNPSLKLLAVDREAATRSDSGAGAYAHLKKEIESGAADITLLNAEFSQFAELIPQLRALSPAEQIERSIKQISGDS